MLISAVWRAQPGKFFCIATKDAAGRFKEKFFERGALRDADDYVADNRDKDVYACYHGFTKPVRRKEYAVPPKLLYADLDRVDPHKLNGVKPTIAIESSPGRYVGIWKTDKPITEDLNRRLTYALGADKGGWDFTQVLRVPRTRNYKYEDTPRVRLLWDDGPTYDVARLEKKYPEKEKPKEDVGSAREIFEQYANKMPGWLRREVLSGRPTPGKRSDVLWKIQHGLIDVGMTKDEAFVVVKASPWNKFKGRSSEDEQLRRELDKVMATKLSEPEGRVDHEHDKYVFLAKSLADVEEEDIEWIWHPYLARREVTILEGDPGLGKSYLAQMVGKSIVDGERLPMSDGEGVKTARGKVAFFDTENTAASVTKKRMRLNGIKNWDNFYQEPMGFSIDDLDTLQNVYDALERIKPLVVVFDTINLYIGGADTSKASETTQALYRFKEIATRFNCAVVLVRHLTKGKAGEKALYRGQGNIAFTGVARIVLTVGCLPDDPDVKVMAMTKTNLSRYARALTFTIEALPNTLTERDRSRFDWGDFVDVTSEDILGVAKGGEAVTVAVKFLEDELKDGEYVEVRKLEVMAEKRSIKKTTLHRASKQLEVVKKRRGAGKGSTVCWKLP